LKPETLRNKQGLTETEFLQQYDVGKYERPSVTADILIFTVMDEAKVNYRKLPAKVLKLLLIQRGNHPFLGQWALPGGFVNIDEDLGTAARRELREETNLDLIYLEQLYTWGEVHRDPRTRVISCSYLALLDSTALAVRAGDDAAAAQWFQVDYRTVAKPSELLTPSQGVADTQMVELTLNSTTETLTATVKVGGGAGCRAQANRKVLASQGIAFDHAKMITYAIERLRNKLEYTDLAFNLVPEVFTISALQQVYEVILGKTLLAAAFRRKIAKMVLPTDRYTQDVGHRPSKLYRFNPRWRE
jgi:8-oxo-dGTP diphosphatase